MRTNIVPLFKRRLATKAEALSRRGAKWRLWDKERAEEVYNVYLDKRTRYQICLAGLKPGGDEIWNMILVAIDAGFITPSFVSFSSRSDLNLRLLFPRATTNRNRWTLFSRYHLSDPAHREYIRTVIWPVAIANKEAVNKDPDCLERLVNEHLRQEERKAIERQRQEAQRKAIEALPPGEQMISMYGMTVWPHPTFMTYTYDQAKAACYYFNDLLHMLDQSVCFNTPKSKAMAIRFSTRAIQRFADRTVIALVDSIANAMELRPDEPCNMPPNPTDGRW